MEYIWVFWILYRCIASLVLFSAAVNGGDDENNTDMPPQPRFLDSPMNYTYEEGELARLECSLENLGTKKVVWRKSSDPNPLTIGRRTFVDDTRVMVEHMPLGQDWHLLIKQVRLDDEGTYECQVSSTDRELRRYVNLIVIPGNKPKAGKPEIHISGTVFVEKNNDIRLVCNATGQEHPPDDIDWFVNGQKLITDFSDQVFIQKRVSLTEKTIYSILEIRSADMADSGMYICRTSDLQITSTRVDVLNADTKIFKREEVVSTNLQHHNSQMTSQSSTLGYSPTEAIFALSFVVLLGQLMQWFQDRASQTLSGFFALKGG